MDTLEHHIKLNSWLAFAITLVNIALLYYYLYGFQEVSEDNRLFIYPLILLSALTVQLGAIAYFDESPNKKLFQTLAISVFVITVLVLIILVLLTGYSKGFNH